MEKWVGKVAVVTGASAGIGAGICKRLAEEGLQVVGLARRVERVEELSKNLQNGKIHALKCDVTKLNEVKEIFNHIINNIGSIQILINNAGLYTIGTFTDGNPEEWQTVMDTNFQSVLSCSHFVLQDLKRTQLEGHIVNINSISGHYLVSHYPSVQNVYSASKHALTCVTECLRREMVHDKINVKFTSLSPGNVKTDINVNKTESFKHEYNLDKQPSLSVEDINDTIIYILGTPRHIHIRELIISPTGERF